VLKFSLSWAILTWQCRSATDQSHPNPRSIPNRRCRSVIILPPRPMVLQTVAHRATGALAAVRWPLLRPLALCWSGAYGDDDPHHVYGHEDTSTCTKNRLMVLGLELKKIQPFPIGKLFRFGLVCCR
jgi:hypothetical protein